MRCADVFILTFHWIANPARNTEIPGNYEPQTSGTFRGVNHWGIHFGPFSAFCGEVQHKFSQMSPQIRCLLALCIFINFIYLLTFTWYTVGLLLSEPVVIGNVRVSLQTDLMYVWSDVDCHMSSASVTAGLTYSGSTQPGVHLGPWGWKLAELWLDSIESMKISNAVM